MRWPDLFVLGAAKSGTTSIHRYLSEHPDIFMSEVKEPGYFAFVGDPLDYRGPGDAWMHGIVTTSREPYCALFDQASSDQMTGESSPVYLFDPDAPKRIREQVPEARLIVVLRNPIDRAFSHFRFMIACGREPEWSFMRALEAERTRLSDKWEWGWSYLGLGFYHEQLTRYLDLFDRRQLHVILFEDLEADAAGEMKKIYHFLNVDSSFVPDTASKLNVTTVTRGRRVLQVLKSTGIRRAVQALTTQNQRRTVARSRLLGSETLAKESIDSVAVGFLRRAYDADITALQDLLNRDLSGWMTPSS